MYIVGLALLGEWSGNLNDVAVGSFPRVRDADTEVKRGELVVVEDR